ncbi:serine/threonine-protein phosphatase [Nonomuraea terrae]|uniref:Serine/threonine-protein phosphatase n=1 Tax=Nonomuraea terrae TaxID=2530383 RepID=A0A4R4ZCQ7_9ACTN|nr:protein phosphatase 2C domain-containing protein [Nonomuraea terrae]TDD54112.1 serine/threonine-protein phosphatase [Nonomuraea terrae]
MIRYALRTRPGRLHGENQDVAAADPAGGTFIVADGIGGLADAATTARTVVDHFPRRVCEHVAALRAPGVARAVTEAAAELNERVRRTARGGPGTTGATAALLLVRDGAALAVHVGDSRIYLARDGRLDRLTEDHVREGRLTRFMGMPGEVVPGISVHELTAGDRLLLCTDGLTGSVGDEALAAILTTAPELESACERLIRSAAAGGAIDDVSMIAVQYEGRGDGAAQQR